MCRFWKTSHTDTVSAALVPKHGDELGFVSGSWTLEWVNPVDEPQSEIYLRLYSNDPRYAEALRDFLR